MSTVAVSRDRLSGAGARAHRPYGVYGVSGGVGPCGLVLVRPHTVEVITMAQYGWLSGIFQTPPDLVVKFQPVDIVGFIL
jgi:hypothetical protein